jgi:hypothetical protein
VDLPAIQDLQEMNSMLADRVKTWTEEWEREGMRKGFEQGIPRGEAKLLRRLIARRFGAVPAWVDARLDGASEAELEAWGERVLDAASLEAIFAEPQ